MNNITRREFVTRIALLSSCAMTYPKELLAQSRSTQPSSVLELRDHKWKTIQAVQNVLFPAAEDTPGASDVGAAEYLLKALKMPQNDDREFIFKGVGWTNDLAQTQYQKTFTQLKVSQQEELISVIAKSRAGRNWLSKLLTYIVEALLTAPVYGGNKKVSGWKWLEYQAGFPLPASDKTWEKLAQVRYQA